MTTCEYTFGSDLTFSGVEDATVSVKIEPFIDGTANHLVWAATGQPLDDFAIDVKGAAGEEVSVILPHTDQAGFVDPSGAAFTGWGYTATVTAKRGKETRTKTKTLIPLVGQTSIDGDLVPDGAFATPVGGPVAVVTSLAGQTGEITAVELGTLVPDNSLVMALIFGS
jgi:hypothetical protein